MSLADYQKHVLPLIERSKTDHAVAEHIRFWDDSSHSRDQRYWRRLNEGPSATMVHVLGIDRDYIPEVFETCFEVKVTPMWLRTTRSETGTRFTTQLSILHICTELREAGLWGMVILDRINSPEKLNIGGKVVTLPENSRAKKEYFPVEKSPREGEGLAFMKETDTVLAAAYMAANSLIDVEW